VPLLCRLRATNFTCFWKDLQDQWGPTAGQRGAMRLTLLCRGKALWPVAGKATLRRES
jgi:hypothetical protein